MDDLKTLYEEIGMPDEAAEALNRTETGISEEATENLSTAYAAAKPLPWPRQNSKRYSATTKTASKS